MAFSGVSECLPTLRFPARKGASLRALGGERRRRVRLGGGGGPERSNICNRPSSTRVSH